MRIRAKISSTIRNTKTSLIVIIKLFSVSLVCLIIFTSVFPSYQYNYYLNDVAPPPRRSRLDIQKDKRLKQSSWRHNPKGVFYVKPQKEKLFILLIGGFRTGSTFLGELFNRNPNVLYQYEPLYQETLDRLVYDFNLFGVTSHSTILERQLAYLDQITQKCVIGKAFFEEMTVVKRCGTDEENLLRFGNKECPPGIDRRFDILCIKKDTVVLKIIRLQKIEQLTLIPNLKNVNFKIIHLMRDPRGTMNSRASFGSSFIDDTIQVPLRPLTESNMRIAADNLCQRELDNVMFSERLPNWMKDRYYRVTLRDLCLHPIATSRKIYTFVGLPMPKIVEDWLLENTDSKNDENGTHISTKRDSKSVSNKWKKMDIDMIKVVEKSCATLMKYMGYKNWEASMDS